MSSDERNDDNMEGIATAEKLDELPEEILEIIRLQNSPRFLDALAVAALKPELTLQLFTRYEDIFADTSARWIGRGTEGKQDVRVIGAFARILQLAPHLSTFLEKYLEKTSNTGHERRDARIQCLWQERGSSVLELQRILLATLRLLNFNGAAFSRTISAANIQQYLKHEDRGVRYLAILILCQLCFASETKVEAMIEEHVGKSEAVLGDFDGKTVDFGFLTLFEEKRLRDAANILRRDLKPISLELQQLSEFVVRYSNTLLPRSNGPPSQPSTLVQTATTSENRENFAKSILSSSPILLHGLAGSGKTSLVNDFARELGMDSDMITLHLNEQTDAKMLIGMYASGSKPGSFIWRAGVLTTAVREGRWVFIEDLDRAPNEVISVILPLIERGELLIPSRGETIKAGRGFKLLASIRTSLSVTGHENLPALHMLGSRLWQRVPVQMPSQEEFSQIIHGTYPILHKFLPGIIRVYERLYILSQKPSFASKSRTSLGRPISPRDLLKWCRRLDGVLRTAGSQNGNEPITDAIKDEMFLEAADCFASSLQSDDTRKTVISAIAEEMHIDPQRVEHFLTSHVPPYQDSETELTIGRVRLQKRPANRVTKPPKKSRPFANTTHAKRLLEQVGVAVKMMEPVLLVGETGIGKTTVVQQLADSLGYKLTAVNLSQQSEVGDLLGGFKPVNIRSLAIPLKDEFDDLFAATGISATKNQKYLESLGKCVAKSQWSKASKLWREAPKKFNSIVSELKKKEIANGLPVEQPTKRRKTESRLQSLLQLKPRWERFSHGLAQFDIQLSGGSKGFAFTFVEGNIVKAARNGDWVLLDEINLASPDTLESIADLLHHGSGGSPSILLSETGEIERVKAHPNFRIFGAMNPATDVGKRDLPMGLRSRFTEIYVESPDRNLDDLLAVIQAYLKGNTSNDEKAAHDVARLYLNTKQLADQKQLVDGANQVPHFSLRTLTRVLSYVVEITPSYGLRRALYEGFAMGFLTLLDRESEKLLMPLIDHHLLSSHGNARALLAQTPRRLDDGKLYKAFMNKKRDRQYWMLQGSETPQEQTHYIKTPSVERNMLNLVRATSTRRFPVLVQGPTSSGKTSMIEYLAKFSGNKFVRINNHEHTDLQEYLGTYISGSDGQLRFQEGLLVQALRQGHWIVLDELNLAPTDVLEALNRLLDDNRELLIPETQEIVRPHENFMLFATQNPPGLYGGRKTLSRAFRNRFLELHFDDIPQDELQQILEYRSQKVAPSDCKRIVDVYKELSTLRQSNRIFEQKESFATLRDLFRWALRDANNREQLAANGYMLLAERVRNPAERTAVKEIIEKVMKVKIDPVVLYGGEFSPEIEAYNETSNIQGVVWTQAMRRLYVLVAHALRNNEPVLLVGETGCGKTTVCQMLAEAFGKELHIVNAHQNTETGDLIGAQRPVRNRAVVLEQLKQDLLVVLQGLNAIVDDDSDVEVLMARYRSLPVSTITQAPTELLSRIELNQGKAKALFEWSDGSLVQALKDGSFFLLDEISLADDSVLERLNSVLETQRTILLAEKGVDNSFVQAAEGFQFFATMNPGGDYGKRELSPALRNRFTEIWVPSLSEHEDVYQIVEAKLNEKSKHLSKAMVHFAEWFGENYRSSSPTSISVRDVLAWVKFMNSSSSTDSYFAVLHGAAMVYIDTLGANPAALLAINPDNIVEERKKCLSQLSTLLKHDISSIYFKPVELFHGETSLIMGDFSILKQPGSESDPGFAFNAPTTKLNAMRVIRALQVQKPILIEGSPGVGKTTLIAALARACNRPLTRINLSEQTDLMDLFGSDVPVEGADAGHFAWRDAPFLQAMQNGEWVLLDEMNLASQSVLEGLNACLDHRGEVYISELDQTFRRHPHFSVFAAQNPHHQGGGRKGLPSSFVNRFTVVHNFPAMPDEIVNTIIAFVSRLEHEIVHQRRFGSQGGPWEFNLRDILRWLQLLGSSAPLLSAATPSDFLDLIFRQRFRTPKDRQEVNRIFAQVFCTHVPFRHFFHNMSSSAYQVGLAYMARDTLIQRIPFPAIDPISRLPEIESVMICIQQNLPCILVGPSGSGKTTILEHIAAVSGKSLTVFPLNADIDTMDLVGGFEQVDPQRAASSFLKEMKEFIQTKILGSLPGKIPDEALKLLELLNLPGQTTPAHFTSLSQNLLALQEATSLEAFGTLATTCTAFASRPMAVENARFEWVDGVLVKALEQGSWLVLDNANLCSASVLDRLNSLLEPNGFLSINEHCGPDGEPKVVRPSEGFRVFLTMDARFGELSRAMRNRAVEVFVEPLELDHAVKSELARMDVNVKVEAGMRRFQNLAKVLDVPNKDPECARLLYAAALDNLSWSDMPLLSRFVEAFQHTYTGSVDFATICESYDDIYQGPANQQLRAAIGSILGELAMNNKLSVESFRETQVIHPLRNSPLVPLLAKSISPDHAFWLGAVFELIIDISTASKAHSTQENGLEALKPSKMNRLQRSLVGGRVAAVTKDSTINISEFLRDTLIALSAYLQCHTGSIETWKIQQKAFRALLRYWWNTFQLATSRSFEESTFQAHLAIGSDLLNELSSTIQVSKSPISLFAYRLQTDFASGFKLTTGLSMELLWRQLRPAVIPNFNVMDTLAQMEKLALRFDTLRWKTAISVAELGHIMTSLVKAYKLILTSDVDGASLIATLSTEMESLEQSIGSEEDDVTPFFTSEFEALRQFRMLDILTSGSISTGEAAIDVDALILSNHATTSEMQFASSTTTSENLQAIDYLLGTGGKLQPVTDTFSTEMLKKLSGVGEVDLKSLRLFETELPAMGQKLALSTATLSRDQIVDLNGVLSTLLLSVISAHGPEIATPFLAWRQSLPLSTEPGVIDLSLSQAIISQDHLAASTPTYLREVLTKSFGPAVLSILASRSQSDMRVQFSSLAWIHFAIGCITLYVPDRAFDPDKRQRLERERHSKYRADLQTKLAALREFERLFSGQDSSLRCQLLEIELLELGEPPQILQEIYRPDVSEMDQLQGEFGNMLKTVLGSDLAGTVSSYFKSSEESGLQQIKLLSHNVDQTIRRLSERFRAYKDLTAPVISMLRCLQIGLSMATLVSAVPSAKNETSLLLSKMTPFLGGGPSAMNEDIISSQPMEYLALIATKAATEKLSSFNSTSRQALFKGFHGCYDQWKKRLESDRLEAETNSGLYVFRGSAEDEEEHDQEQFNELFPAYDDDVAADKDKTKGVTPAQFVVRETAIGLSKVHSEIFLGSTMPQEAIISSIRKIAKRVGSVHEDAPFSERKMTRTLLPGTMLLLSDSIETLNSSTAMPAAYNFYTSANLPETRKLVTLTHQIITRFRALQAVDEIGHMQPLADVLDSCHSLLSFRHTEPLAKIITKVEKVHTFMHEWQFGGWASRANSALSLYDEVTATIVNWRRLELSTWAKLFETEKENCEDDARSWFFLAYEVVVAVPLQIYDSPDELRVYTQKLLKDLEAYFHSAILGQFVQRMLLLKQLQNHLTMLALDMPHLSIIANAVGNFIALYQRYEKAVEENLKRGRVGLEKAMKDVLLMASWKDTNIVALRDSAKRSHHKLFKIVRKFRSLLGQPMESILKNGLPDEVTNPTTDEVSNVQIPAVDETALQICATAVPEWNKKAKRFINVNNTVSMMASTAQLPTTAIECSTYLDSFLANIIISTAELQKATPALLTEENKDVVKHLKSRKRKLFADTLKALRQMGVKYNLGADALKQQDSLSVVLANVEALNGDGGGMEYYFHKAVDLAPRVRASVHEHNQDLSGAEVARSTGFLEGLLQVLLIQRNFLSNALKGLSTIETNIKMVEGLWNPAYTLKNLNSASNHEKLLRWLPNVLLVAIEFVTIHAKLGKIDSKYVLGVLGSWHDRFGQFARQWEECATLPEGVVSTASLSLEEDVTDAAQQLNIELSNVNEQRPDLAFILNQILPWTSITTTSNDSDSEEQTLTNLNQKLSTVCDTVLVAMEKYKKTIAELPSSTEDPGWLTKNDTCLSSAIKSLHSENISQEIDQAFAILRSIDLDHPKTSQAAPAIFAVALPILRQYTQILRESISRYASLHRATCKTSYILAKTFIQIATQGFCTPSEKSAAQDGQTEKLEGGTGLGDGEGAEDISKDIQDDENLDELAQEPNKEKGDIEDEDDAVDMADGDMEGEMGEGEEKEEGEGEDEESGDEMDEEAGDVDDLDAGAVDEKMWDGAGEEENKEQEGDDAKGEQKKDEQVAAEEGGKENKAKEQEGDEGDAGDEEEEEMEGAEQGEEVKQDEVERHDPTAQEGETLDLPEDMELDGEEGSEKESEDEMGDLSDVEENDKEGDEVKNDGKEEEGADNANANEEQQMVDEMDIVDLDEEPDDEGEKTEEAGEKVEEESPDQEPEDQEGLLQDRNDDANADADNAVPSDVQGVGEDQNENSPDDKTDATSKAQREDGGKGGDSSEQKDAAAEDGEKGRQANGDAPQDSRDDTENSAAAQPFKKLGDALERWHRQQSKIHNPEQQKEEQKKQGQDQKQDDQQETSEFQHMQDENAEADAQALGTATEEQAKALDESMAVDEESKELPEQFQPDDVETDDVERDGMDIEEPSTPKEQEPSDAYEGRAGAMIKQANPALEEDLDARAQMQEDLEEDVEEVDSQLDRTHLDSTVKPQLSLDSRAQWQHYSSLTRDLSLSLTEQLRLILAPTLATKMRGDFRTGKRLNIKRIIPYIASSYKRDKIWMRRSVPSKRSYQIMLAVDDSKSMGESGSGALALETLVMISKSLSMLEVGQISVVGFGEGVKVAHDFETPFSADAGPNLLSEFSFNQERTDVTRLVRESINLFREARQKASSSPIDLWQIQLIISDGVCNSSEHDTIRRLLRTALEERIMIVFVIVDDVRKKGKGESVLDLREAKFVDGKVEMGRYLEGFPFKYFLVVGDVGELPGVLAGVLRSWFGEVVDSS
ncbi:related to midasin (AAA ATPase) [Rhynchosporium secalis]|uniref:Midasin n=1 Tax=Rhynchosporium secalis TaxID=38038 RepID=A0A1E1MPS8_RHYSE|nr:related to midasin (AAA ATPase) [Rhynchosporium secalis]